MSEEPLHLPAAKLEKKRRSKEPAQQVSDGTSQLQQPADNPAPLKTAKVEIDQAEMIDLSDCEEVIDLS